MVARFLLQFLFLSANCVGNSLVVSVTATVSSESRRERETMLDYSLYTVTAVRARTAFRLNSDMSPP